MTELAFIIPGKPQPKARARRNPHTRRWVTPTRTRQYEARVKAYALRAIQERKTDLASCYEPWPMKADKYRVEIMLYFPDKRRRDPDNVVKSVLDGCIGVLWDDDHRIASSVDFDWDKDEPRTVVRVVPL